MDDLGAPRWENLQISFEATPSGCRLREALRHPQPRVQQTPQGVLGKHAEEVAPQEVVAQGKRKTHVRYQEFSGI